MRKILLASTAIVALTSVSAMATDITISGSSSLILSDNSTNTNGGGNIDSEMDMSVSFSNTMDNGLTAGMSFGLDENIGGGFDGLNWTLAGDFGTLKVSPDATSANYVAAMDDTGNYAGEGMDIAADIFGSATGGGTTIGLSLPAVSGVAIALEAGQDHFGAGATVGVGPATINVAQMKSSTEDGSSASVELGFGAITIGYEQNKIEAASETEGTIMGAKYVMGATTIAYEKMDHKTGNTKDKESTQLQASYTVTPGVTAVVSSSDISGTASGTTELTEIQLKVSF